MSMFALKFAKGSLVDTVVLLPYFVLKWEHQLEAQPNDRLRLALEFLRNCDCFPENSRKTSRGSSRVPHSICDTSLLVLKVPSGLLPNCDNTLIVQWNAGVLIQGRNTILHATWLNGIRCGKKTILVSLLHIARVHELLRRPSCLGVNLHVHKVGESELCSPPEGGTPRGPSRCCQNTPSRWTLVVLVKETTNPVISRWVRTNDANVRFEVREPDGPLVHAVVLLPTLRLLSHVRCRH